jgi:hypothetical protein
MDDRLTWKFHINELCKKLGRSVGMLYKLRHLCPANVLRSLYFSLFNSHLTYGLPVWGNTAKIYTDKVLTLQKKAIRAITFSDYLAPSQPIFKELEILSFSDLYKHQTASLMWDLDHDILPSSLASYFTKIRENHPYPTRLAASDKLAIKKCNTKSYGFNSFQIQGALLLNDLKDKELYTSARSKKSFLNNLKKSYLDSY